MSPSISIIVPAYNCEAYLQRTLNSIIAQQIQDWEAIVVDDGSTDDTGIICDAFSQQDHRFIVIHQENMGPGKARNTGIRHATGEYICFVDGGDYLHPQAIGVLFQSMNRGAELSIMGFQIVNPEESINEDSMSINEVEIISKDNLIYNLLSTSLVPGLTWAVVWNKMYKSLNSAGFFHKN